MSRDKYAESAQKSPTSFDIPLINFLRIGASPRVPLVMSKDTIARHCIAIRMCSLMYNFLDLCLFVLISNQASHLFVPNPELSGAMSFF
jgi:hypothetical protein